MQTSNIRAAKHSAFSPSQTASKTVCKFTQFFGANALPQAVSVVLDWLSFMVECTLKEPAPDQGPVWLSDRVVLEYLQKGTPVFNYSNNIYLDGELVAMVHTHGKNQKIIKPGTAKLEILNHVLYSSTVMDVVKDVMLACEMPMIKNVSGLHIAIDGANHVPEFLNKYIRQSQKRARPDLMNLQQYSRINRVKMKGKANLDCKRFNKKTGNFDNFKCGSSKKNLTVYNKTSELLRSHKQYIRDAWERAGIDTTGTVWRVELRLSSGPIKEIKDFSLDRLTDPNYLLSIFKTQCNNFFQFVIMNDCNVSRATVIDLFQFEKLKVPLLQKIPRAIVKGAYKAQMAIHNAYANIRLSMFKTVESIGGAMQHIADNLDIYNLREWFERKKTDWDSMYLTKVYAPEPPKMAYSIA